MSEIDCSCHINNGFLTVIVRPNAKKTEIIGWDDAQSALRIAVAAVPDKDKANKELIRFLSRELKAKVSIKSGAKSRKKVIQVSTVSS